VRIALFITCLTDTFYPRTGVAVVRVLEHLGQPEQLLAGARGALRKDGFVVVSLPNVANFTVRLMLLLGQFNYAERGIMDRTHLHFYTRKTARRMLQDCGYEIVDTRATIIPVEIALGLAPSNLLARALSAMVGMVTAILPTLFGYQFVFLARKK